MFKRVALLVVAFSAIAFTAGAVVNADVIQITPSLTEFTDDAGSGISATKTYTHLLDFGPPGTAATVNTVQFDKAGQKDVLSFSGTTTQGYGYLCEVDDLGSYQWNYAGGKTAYIGVASGTGMYTLLNDMSYGHGDHTYEKYTLSGLHAGTTYDFRLYYRPWDENSTRNAEILFDYGDGNVYKTPMINEDSMVGMPPYNATYLSFQYTATAAGNLIVTIQQEAVSTSWHNYGFSNEVFAVPEPSALALLACGLVGLLAYAWRKRR